MCCLIFEVLPLAVGWVEPQTVTKVLAAFWGGPETVIVVSSDLSHYQPYEVARALSELGAAMNSFPPDAGSVLTGLARQAISRQLGSSDNSRPMTLPWLDVPGAAFVTLTKAGDLRGCIGSLQAYRPLADDVRANAIAAALDDPRFRPVAWPELEHLRIDVSVLSSPVPITFTTESDALSQLRPHIDGLILRSGHHRATFLPQVWTDLPEPAAFIGQLKRKAGLRDDFWGPDLKLERYTVTAFSEPH